METIKYTDNLIPAMTSNTTPSGVSSASSIYSDTYAAWKAFDGKNSTELDAWATKNGTVNGWLEYDFTEAKSITKYTILSRTGSDIFLKQVPKDWTFEAWDELNNTWVILDKQNNVTDWSFGIKKEFTFINSKLFKKYRINITANNGYANHTTIGELEMMETVPKVKLALEVNEEKQLSVGNDLNDNADMIWTSSDAAVATVSVDGKIKAVKPGNTIITCSSRGGSYTEAINVLVAELNLLLAIDLEVGELCKLTVDDLTDKIHATWASDDQAIATVSDKRKVTAVDVGFTYITVTDGQGNEIGKICVRVRK